MSSFVNGSSANIKVSKTHIPKMVQLWGTVAHEIPTIVNILSNVCENRTHISRDLGKTFPGIDMFNKKYLIMFNKQFL